MKEISDIESINLIDINKIDTKTYKDWNRLSFHKNLTWKFIIENKDEDWNFIALSKISGVELFTMMKIRPDANWNMVHISWRIDLDWKFVIENPLLNWAWDILSNRMDLELDIVYSNQHLQWKWDCIIHKKSFDYTRIAKDKLLELFCIISPIEWKQLKFPEQKLEDVIMLNPKDINWEVLSYYASSNLEVVAKYSDKPWNWIYLSKSPHLSFGYIESLMNKAWDMIAATKLVKDIDSALSKYKDKICLITLGQRSDLKWETIAKFSDLDWDWRYLSTRSDLDWKFVSNYPKKNWNWQYIINRKDFDWSIMDDGKKDFLWVFIVRTSVKIPERFNDKIKKDVKSVSDKEIMITTIEPIDKDIESYVTKYKEKANTVILSQRPDLKWETIAKFSDLDWDWRYLSTRSDLDWKFVSNYPKKNWNWQYIINRKDFDWSIMDDGKKDFLWVFIVRTSVKIPERFNDKIKGITKYTPEKEIVTINESDTDPGPDGLTEIY